MEIVQLLMNTIVVLGVAWSYRSDEALKVIKPILLLQAFSMTLSNFNIYEEGEEGYHNSEGLNTLSTIFAVIFTIFNTLLLSFVVKVMWVKVLITTVVFMT